MAAAIEVSGLTKRYGSRRGIEDITFAVHPGELFGFIGPNGAGKSTTIRTLLGLMRPDGGRASLLGRDVASTGANARLDVGYLPGELQFYDDLSVASLLEYLGSFHAGDHRKRRMELAETFGLDLSARAVDLSLGNRKKVGVVAALQHRPRLVILDEPTNGLDPLVQARLFAELEAEQRRGTTIFFSSHVLSEVQRVCQRVAVLSEGRLVALENVEELRHRQVRRIRTALPASTELNALRNIPGVSDLQRGANGISFLFGGEISALLPKITELKPSDLLIEEPSLEEIFMRYYAHVA